MTGEAPPPPDEDDDRVSMRDESVPPQAPLSPVAPSNSIAIDPLSGAIRGTTLKQWTQGKLTELVGLRDAK